MEISTLVSVLDQPVLAENHLHKWSLRDAQRGQQILIELAETGLPLELLSGLCRQLAEHLPRTADPDATFEAFGRFMRSVRGPLGIAGLFERDPLALGLLLAALSLGPRWAELLISDPEAFDFLRQAEEHPIEKEALSGEVMAEALAFSDERSIVAALSRLRQRHLLRIAYGEIVVGNDLQHVQAQLSVLADTLVEVALAAALRKTQNGRAVTNQPGGADVRIAVVGVGALGAAEPAYDLTLELLFVYEAAAADAAALRTRHERFDRVAKQTSRQLSEIIADGKGDAVRLISLPDSPVPAAAHAAEDVVIGFDSFGRTWHRQELLKARSVAGNRELGDSVLTRLAPWLFRRYLGRADETGIKALKRRLVLRATLHQDDWRDVWLARGGLADIRATVEFLQLLAGGDQPAARQAGTLGAIGGLAQAGTVTADEKQELEESYVYFQRLQHRLQIMGTEGATELPADSALVERIATLLGKPMSAAKFEADLKERLNRSWQTLNRLLASAFPEEPPTPREVELLLDPAPPPEEVRAALAPFGFQRPAEALVTLNDLAAEQVPFLSTRRCRHLLAQILPQLLCAVGATPNPDHTLDHLARVSNSVGGKGVLWDLFRFNAPSLDLYVKLCAASPYLSDILTTNPGMIDELVDSLQLDKLPTRRALADTLAELCRGVSDTMPVLHDFKNAEHLRIGVRDILGKEDIDRTHAALADVAEIGLRHVAELEFDRLVEKFGQPAIGPGPSEGQPSRAVIVGLGKLGGREPNYHSHLDVMFVYEAEGTTRPTRRYSRQQRTANNHFFTQLAQAIIKQLSQHTPKGRLYTVDPLLRPIGVGGALALPFHDFAQHFASGAAPLWQWQALCQARPVFGDDAAGEQVSSLIRQLIVGRQWTETDVAEIRRTRLQLERGASERNLKRGSGGTMDVEFIVQMLQLRHGGSRPDLLITNTQNAVAALGAAGILSPAAAEKLGDSYRFLRRVESGLRLMATTARHDLPTDSGELRQLALLLGHSNGDRLAEQCLQHMAENRAEFERVVS